MEPVRGRRVRSAPAKEAVVEEPPRPLTTPPGVPTEGEKMFLPQPNGGRIVKLTVEITAEIARGRCH